MVTLGSNQFDGVAYPLVINDRYFQLHDGPAGRVTLDVFRWDSTASQRRYEVKAGRPVDTQATTNATGIVSFGTDETGFLFKFRPDNATSHIFGRIPTEDGVAVHINDRELHLSAGIRDIATLTSHTIRGCAIGLHITPDGLRIGSNMLPPELRGADTHS